MLEQRPQVHAQVNILYIEALEKLHALNNGRVGEGKAPISFNSPTRRVNKLQSIQHSVETKYSTRING